MTDTPEYKLEELIDALGAGNVLELFSTICRGKAEHIRANWQDSVTAQGWDMAASRVEKICQYVRDVT